MILKQSIEKLMRQETLDISSCQQAFEGIVNADLSPLQVAAFLVLLRAKPETAEELACLVKVLRKKMLPLSTPHRVLDIVGTGGDGLNTINISTGSAILAASCGIKVAKHGNHAASSLTGSADVLAALGVPIQLSVEKISASIDEVGIGFCYAPNFHPVTRQLSHLRKELGVPTSFNLLGPLLNPAQAEHLLLGVLDDALLQKMAAVLTNLGCGRSVVVHGCGLDEISCVGVSHMIEIESTAITEHCIDPADVGLSYCSVADLQGGDAQWNATLLKLAFAGKHQAIAETLILNTAVALYIYGSCDSIKQAVAYASDTLYRGDALTLLKNWIEFSHD